MCETFLISCIKLQQCKGWKLGKIIMTKLLFSSFWVFTNIMVKLLNNDFDEDNGFKRNSNSWDLLKQRMVNLRGWSGLQQVYEGTSFSYPNYLVVPPRMAKYVFFGLGCLKQRWDLLNFRNQISKGWSNHKTWFGNLSIFRICPWEFECASRLPALNFKSS